MKTKLRRFLAFSLIALVILGQAFLPALALAATGDVKNVYAARATITVTLTSLTTGTARESTVIDNTTNKYVDALLRVKTNAQAGCTTLVDIYVYAALGDTTYTDAATGTDAAFTLANRRNSPYLGSVQMNTTTSVTGGLFSVASAFKGTLPDKWGLLFLNNCGGTLSATGGDHVVEYEGVYLNVSP